MNTPPRPHPAVPLQATARPPRPGAGRRLAALIALAAGLLAAPLQAQQPIPSSSLDRAVYADVDDVYIDAIRSRYEGRFLTVAFDLVNKDATGFRRPVYMIEWLDADGFVVSSSAWKPVTVSGNQRVSISETALAPEARDYRVTLSVKGK